MNSRGTEKWNIRVRIELRSENGYGKSTDSAASGSDFGDAVCQLGILLSHDVQHHCADDERAVACLSDAICGIHENSPEFGSDISPAMDGLYWAAQAFVAAMVKAEEKRKQRMEAGL